MINKNETSFIIDKDRTINSHCQEAHAELPRMPPAWPTFQTYHYYSSKNKKGCAVLNTLLLSVCWKVITCFFGTEFSGCGVIVDPRQH